MKAGLYGTVAARLAGIPVIWHVRDRIAEDYCPPPQVDPPDGGSPATAVLANSRTTLDRSSQAGTPVIHSISPTSSATCHRERSSGPLTFGVVAGSPRGRARTSSCVPSPSFSRQQERAMLVGGACSAKTTMPGLPELARSWGSRSELTYADIAPTYLGSLRRWTSRARLDYPGAFGQVILEGWRPGCRDRSGRRRPARS